MLGTLACVLLVLDSPSGKCVAEKTRPAKESDLGGESTKEDEGCRMAGTLQVKDKARKDGCIRRGARLLLSWVLRRGLWDFLRQEACLFLAFHLET